MYLFHAGGLVAISSFNELTETYPSWVILDIVHLVVEYNTESETRRLV